MHAFDLAFSEALGESPPARCCVQGMVLPDLRYWVWAQGIYCQLLLDVNGAQLAGSLPAC